jgi:ADP-ribose pyrophosphatase YjhB (NUDIX family)
MESKDGPMNQWIEWAKQIRAIGQIGATHTTDPYDLERYEQLSDIAHQMMEKMSDAPKDRVDQFFLPETGYATPKVDLRAGIIRENEILLAKERSDQKWSLPGGWADVCESPTEGIIREVYEETGYQIKLLRLVALKDRNRHPYRPHHPHHIYKLFFLGELVGGDVKESIEISEVGFFKQNAIPQLSEGRVLRQDVDMMFRYHEDLTLPVYCD